MRLGERGRNPANTGNLEDLFCYTLIDTKDPIRAYAQCLADSVKVVPMDAAAVLYPRIRRVEDGALLGTVGDLVGYNAGNKMLIAHTMAAYGDPENARLCRSFIEATDPDLDPAGIERVFNKMVVQSQHGPSSTFVLARTRGLTLELDPVYSAAGYAATQIAAAQKFYDTCAEFDPAWVTPFLNGYIPNSAEWSSWRLEYLEHRKRLPEELIYQLSSDTLTNFLDGTLESGKWTDASVMFSGISDPREVPAALAKIVNQYVAEHIALHDRPAQELMDAVAEPLAPWGVGFERGRAISLPGTADKNQQIRAQFDAAWRRVKGPDVAAQTG